MYTWQGIKSFSTLLAVTITMLCYLQRASCAPLVRRSADNPGDSISTNLGLIEHTINLRIKLHTLLESYKCPGSNVFLETDIVGDVSASQVAGIKGVDEPVPNFSGFNTDSCSARNDDMLAWITLNRAEKIASHLDTLDRFRKFMDDIPKTNGPYKQEAVKAFLNRGGAGDVLFQNVTMVTQEIVNVMQELNATENPSGNSKLNLRNITACPYRSSPDSSSDTSSDSFSSISYSSSSSGLDERFFVLYILQEFNVYATGALSTIYMNDEVTCTCTACQLSVTCTAAQ